MVIEFGNLMDLEINFTAQNLAKAIIDNKIKGIYETAPCFASMLIHYNPDEMDHGSLTSSKRHVGDLENIMAGADKTAKESGPICRLFAIFDGLLEIFLHAIAVFVANSQITLCSGITLICRLFVISHLSDNHV